MSATHETPSGLVAIDGFYADPSMLPATYVALRCCSCKVAAGPVVEGKVTAARQAQARGWDVQSDDVGVFGICGECAQEMRAS